MKRVKQITIEFENGEKFPYRIDNGYGVSASSKRVVTSVFIDDILTPMVEKSYTVTGIIIHPEYCDIQRINDVINNFGE